MSVIAKGWASAAVSLAVFGLLLFLPAGTFRYWQAWVFLAVFALASWIPTWYLLRTNPAALERRMHVGPWAEARPVQRVLITGLFVCFPATFVISALDHRFGWAPAPAAISVIGDALVVVGLVVSILVVIQNGYAAANITVEAGQQLVTTGLYGLVRHPMYAASVTMMVGVPLALGSYWGLLSILPAVLVLIVRIRDEEVLLTAELAGYREYTQQVRYRLVPYLW